MPYSTDAERVCDPVEEIGVCISASKSGSSLRARPDLGETRKVGTGGRR
ncbi:hypothetical protein [Hansschlegelia zhihuaiae]|nr:hypothetical protein [Hansschlegelia zhihuaiae]